MSETIEFSAKNRSELHTLKITNNKLFLDEKEIQGLISYKVEKSSAVVPTELIIKLSVKDL